MRGGLLLAGTLVITALAGCLDGLDADDSDLGLPAPPFVFENPIVLDHDHSDLAEHTVTNAVDLVGRAGDLLTPEMYAAGTIGAGEVDIAGDHAYVALLGYGFAIVDLTDPATPSVVSRVQAVSPDPVKYAADLKVDETGDWVFLAMELSTTPGVLIYDTSDRANPRLAGAWVEPGLLAGCHMVEYAQIDGQEYLFCAPLDNAIYIGLLSDPDPLGNRHVVQTARFTPTTQKFVEQQTREAPYATKYVSGHMDMTFQEDPLTGTPMIYASFWNMGVRFVDVSNPLLPVEVGSWDGEGAEWYRGLIHTSMAFESEGRRVVVTIPEVAVPPAVFVIDATDFDDPKLLAEWKALDDFQGQDTRYSTHNFQIVDGTLYLAMYHAGLWVLDISTPERQAAPEPVGSYNPHAPRPDGAPYSPGPWDVVVWHGYMLTADADGGFYVLHHAGDPAGAPGYTSFA